MVFVSFSIEICMYSKEYKFAKIKQIFKTVSGLGSGPHLDKKFWILPDQDPQHWLRRYGSSNVGLKVVYLQETWLTC